MKKRERRRRRRRRKRRERGRESRTCLRQAPLLFH
jgi:hypothetical protein